MNDGSPLRADGGRRTARVAGLYAVTPDLDDTDLLLALVAAALDGGATVVQYRHKTADDGLRLAQARALARLCAARGRAFIVNDHVDVALAIDGAGLHVGADDFHDLAGLRRQLGAGRILGVSCYRSPDRARDAVAAGADYVAFGSIFASGTKVHAPVAGHALFAQGTELGVPRVGIGGITADNIDTLVAAGADAAAVIGDLFGSHDPVVVRSRARALASAFARSTPLPPIPR